MLADSAYGKSKIRLVQVRRGSDRHALCDLTIAIRFEGEYDASYAAGDNSDVLPTDTMKNTVYALAARGPVGDPEAFGLRLAHHFIDRNPRLRQVRIDLTEHLWRSIEIGGRPHGQAFMQRGPDARTAVVKASRDRMRVSAGISKLHDSEVVAFGICRIPARRVHHAAGDDGFDLLATSLTATWKYEDVDADFGPRVARRSSDAARGLCRA